ncbi:cytochrome P450 2G1-like [Rhinatrema bivittatum]|uniref:cytochrome P450 2G1-like n=1 Tax=Rhinatrema bivittatum TaxID=194408 RepID=UPI00112D653A|nr:cytochrome P450 2G1-like [Rhinatrema bivittatum]
MELGEAATLLLAFCTTCLLFSAWRRSLRSQRLPPGPFPLPILGNALHLVGKSLIKALKEVGERYGPVCTLYLGSRKVVVVSGLPAVKEALLDQGDAFISRGPFPMLQLFLKDYGIGLSSGERWKQLRRFSLMTLRNFGMGKRSIEEKIQEEAQCLVEEFRKTKEVPFDPTFFFSRAVSNVICSVVFGSRFDYEDKRFLSLLELINKNFRLLNSKWGQLLNAFPQILKYCPGAFPSFSRNVKQLKDFVSEQVKMHQRTLDPNCPRDFIDCFLIRMQQEALDPQSEFHLENLMATTMNLFFAGTETVSSTLRYSFLVLQKHPEVTEKIHTELDLVIGRERGPCMEDRSRMPYTDAVIHEIQRFADIAPAGLPRAVANDTNFRGYTIPKGTAVFFLLTTVLKDPKLFESPETFNPAHFLDKRGCFKKSEAFVPFSIGKRNCIGEGLARMELFLFFVTILQNFTLKPTSHPEDINLVPEISGIGHVPPRYHFSVLPR